jgi:excisionase family DNA binding protein
MLCLGMGWRALWKRQKKMAARKKKAPKAKRQVPSDSLTVPVPEAARLLGISVNGCYEAVKKNLIPSVRINGRIIIPRAALMRMLDVPPPAA